MSLSNILTKPLTICLVISICLTSSVLAETTVYVDGSVASSGDGTLDSPYKTIGEAVESASDITILITGGTYANESARNEIEDGQTLIGSYDSSFTTSDPDLTPTIIDMSGKSDSAQDGTFYINGAEGFSIQNLEIWNSSTGEGDDTNNGGAMYILGGSEGSITGVTFYNCTAKYEGGEDTGPARDGGALCIRSDSTVIIEDCVFDSCTAVGRGGALLMRSVSSGNYVEVNRCWFTNCGSIGGASSIHDLNGASQIIITSSVFVNNGVDVDTPSGTESSNYEMKLADRLASIYNCTFVGCSNPAGPMFYFEESSNSSAVKEIINCIVVDSETGSGDDLIEYASDYDDSTVIQNNLFYSNSDMLPSDSSGDSVIDVNDNIEADPLFVDAENGDYHLKEGSPAEDTGVALELVTDDYEGTVRPVGFAYDMGAYEGQPTYAIENVTATATSSLSDDSSPEKTVDESGLNDWNQHDTDTSNMWISEVGQEAPVWIEYAFDAAYKLEEMWVWNSNSGLESLFGFGVKTATIETSTDGETWTALEDVPEFAQGPGSDDYVADTVVTFDGIIAQYVRITCTSNWGGGTQYSLSEVRFFYLPVNPSEPDPIDGATDISPDVTLSWTAGSEADVHEIYIGTDMQEVADSTTPVATVSEASYSPESLLMNTTYYWKVVEVNELESPSTWTSEVWSFTTSEEWVIDDFESYTNNTPNLVYQTWLDGYGFSEDDYYPDGYEGNGSGSTVGHLSGSVMEYSIVHGGSKSMPVSYDGDSIITRNFDSSLDWSNASTLVIYFYGESGNTGDLYMKINNTTIAYDGDSDDIAAEDWIAWEIDLESSSASLSSVSKMSIGIDGSKADGDLYIDDIVLK